MDDLPAAPLKHFTSLKVNCWRCSTAAALDKHATAALIFTYWTRALQHVTRRAKEAYKRRGWVFPIIMAKPTYSASQCGTVLEVKMDIQMNLELKRSVRDYMRDYIAIKLHERYGDRYEWEIA